MFASLVGGIGMEDINKKILREGYGLRLYGTTRTRTGLICKTDKGIKELKKARARIPEICFSHDVKECIHKKGFVEMNRFYTTLEGQPYFQKEGIVYVVEACLPKETMEESSLEDFKKGAELLGRMHYLGKGISSEFGQWEEERLPKQFQKRKTELGKIKGRIQRAGKYDTIDTMVLSCYQSYMTQVEQAIEFLEKSNYSKIFARAKEESVFCHQGFKGGNIRKEESGKLYLGGFEECSRDIPMLDLAGYLKRYLKKVGGGKSEILELLATYEKQNPLNKEELIFLKAIAVYPEKFLRIINEHYNKRQCCVSTALQQRLEVVIKEEHKTKELWKYI